MRLTTHLSRPPAGFDRQRQIESISHKTPMPDTIRPEEAVQLLRIEDAEALNRQIRQQFEAARQAPSSHQTHHFHGRFENSYVDRKLVPALEPVFYQALAQARALLGRNELKFGFWFNEMEPGQLTSLHAHEELDELLSAVYYVTVPADSGRLVLHLDDGIRHIEPEAGMMVFFPPDLPHEVEVNRSKETRLSVAMNFGPRHDD